jgi:hypothetical protein
MYEVRCTKYDVRGDEDVKDVKDVEDVEDVEDAKDVKFFPVGPRTS